MNTIQRKGTKPVLVSNLELRQGINEFGVLHTEVWTQIDDYWLKAVDHYGEDTVNHRVIFGEATDVEIPS